MAVGLVFVSHSAKIAEGLVDLAAQMAPTVRLLPAGGTAEGGLGTNFDLVQDGIAAADSGDGVVILCDLGSSILTAEMVLEFLDDTTRARVRIVDAPLVEGGVAASVAAQLGETLDGVVRAAESANGGVAAEEYAPASRGPSAQKPGYVRTVTLINADGMHARPAAEFAKLAGTFDVAVTVNGKDARSLLGIMSLGLVRGTRAEIASTDPSGRAAVDALSLLIESGFGEG